MEGLSSALIYLFALQETRRDFLSKGAGISGGRILKDPVPDPLEWTKVTL